MSRSKNAETINLPALARPIQSRIERGSDLLWDMEQRGKTGTDYDRWIAAYVTLVEDYDALTKTMILTGTTTLEAS